MNTICHCTKCDPIISTVIQRRVSQLKQSINIICTEIIYAQAEPLAEAMQHRADKLRITVDKLNMSLEHQH